MKSPRDCYGDLRERVKDAESNYRHVMNRRFDVVLLLHRLIRECEAACFLTDSCCLSHIEHIHNVSSELNDWNIKLDYSRQLLLEALTAESGRDYFFGEIDVAFSKLERMLQ